MAVTAATRSIIIELAVTAYNAAPGTALLSELVEASEGGASLADLASWITASAEFKAIYPTFQTATEFATEFLGNLVPEAPAAALAEGIAVVESILNGGGTRADVILEAATYLAALSESDASFGTSAALFNNKVEVATYYTVTLEQSASSASAIASVTSDDASVVSAKASADSVANPTPAGQSFTLTTGVDTLTGDAGDDSFIADNTGATAVTSTADSLSGGEGSDTLSIFSGGAATALPALSSVEIAHVYDQDDNLDLSGTQQASLTSATLVRGDGELSLTVGSAVTSVGLTDIALSGTGVSIASSATATAQTVNLSAVSTAAGAITEDITLTGAKLASVTLNVNSASSADNIDVAGAAAIGINATGNLTVTGGISTTSAAATVTITGAGNVDLSALDAGIKTVSAADATGKITIEGGAVADAGGAVDAADFTANTGSGNDSIDTSGVGAGAELAVNAGAGNDTVTIGSAVTKSAATTAGDVLNGGDGTDILKMTSALANGFAAASNTISGFEEITISDALGANFNAGYIQSDITTVNLAAGGTGTITLPAGSKTVNLQDVLSGALGLTDTGTATTDSVSVVNEDAAADAFAGQAITSTGFETVNIVTTGSGTATTQTFGAITVTADTGGTSSVTFSGTNRADVNGAITAASVDASGLTAQTAGITLDMAAALVGGTTNTITGSAGDDIIIGDANDTTNIDGGAGDDTITGGTDAETISGGDDDDTIVGGGGADTLAGGAGDDTITGGAGNDTITGGDGDDDITTSSGDDNVDGGAGDDTITIAGNLAYEDTIAGGEGTDTLVISAAVTSVAQTANVTGIEVINTSASQNLTLFAGTGYTTVQLGAVTAAITNAAADTGLLLTGVLSGASSFALKTATGTSDVLTITSKSATGLTQAAALTVAGFETINLVGSDTTVASTDVNTVILTAANATTINVSGNQGISLAGTTAAKVTTFDASAVTAGAVTYTTLNTTVGTDITIKGGAGDDTLAGHSNTNDTIHGGAGDDTITAGNGTNVLAGDAGDDSLTGGTGSDTMDGGAGADTLVYSGGSDTATGGAGADTFDVNALGTTTAHLNVTDIADGDIIDLSDVDTGVMTLTAAQVAAAEVSLGGSATLAQYIAAASAGDGSGNSLMTWFDFGGDTYIVLDNSAGAAFAATDGIIKLTGVVDLGDSAVAAGVLTLDL